MQVGGYSLDAQRDKLRKYAAYEDMVIAGEYSDEGFSGKNIQGRQEFQRMLNDIQDGKDGVSTNIDNINTISFSYVNIERSYWFQNGYQMMSNSFLMRYVKNIM